MRQAIVTVTCDIDGAPDAETVAFEYAGAACEIDLCAPHRAELRQLMAGIAAHARPAARVPAAAHHAVGPRSARGRAQRAAQRAWIRDRHPDVADRGRLPARYIAEWEASHS